MEGLGRRRNKAGEITKGRFKNEKNGEKARRRMKGVGNQPTENTKKKRISERRGRVGGGSGRRK